jgi:hypothetical protein
MRNEERESDERTDTVKRQAGKLAFVYQLVIYTDVVHGVAKTSD